MKPGSGNPHDGEKPQNRTSKLTRMLVQTLSPLLVIWTFELSLSRPTNMLKSLWVSTRTFLRTRME